MGFTYRKMAHVTWAIGHDLNLPIEPFDDMPSTEVHASNVPAEEIAISKIIAKALPGFGKAFGKKVGEEAGKQVASRGVSLIGAGVSGGSTLASMSVVAKYATVYQTDQRESTALPGKAEDRKPTGVTTGSEPRSKRCKVMR